MRIDSSAGIAQFRAVPASVGQRLRWSRLLLAIWLCAAVSCGAQILPQLIVHLVSLNHDHRVSTHATSTGIDVVLAHEHQGPPGDTAEFLPWHQPHVIHISSAATMLKDSSAVITNEAGGTIVYFSTPLMALSRTFVPPLPLVYSRPPPYGEAASLAQRSTQLLI